MSARNLWQGAGILGKFLLGFTCRRSRGAPARMAALLLVACCLGVATPARGETPAVWPQWRGPQRDGQVSGRPWPERIAGDALQPLWRYDLGPGYASPIVAADRVFVAETKDARDEVVRALDRRTGQLLWQVQWSGAMNVPFFAKSNGDWIRCTPAYDGQSLYVGGMRDVLVCLDAQSGAERWRVDCVERFGSPLPAFGFVSSPLVVGEHVYVQAGGGLLKLDKHTGEEVWRKLADGGGMNGSAFSSPVWARLCGREQLVVQTREELVGVDPESGDVLWRQEVPAFRGMNILTPTVYQDCILTSTYGGKTFLYRVTQREGRYQVQTVWTEPAQAYMSSPVVIDGHAYLHLRNQRFMCLGLEQGDRRWTSKPYGAYWSMVANGDRILALDERGDLLLVRATPERFELLDARKISQEPAWAHLAVCGDEVFVREQHAIAAYRWTGSSGPGATAD